MVVFTKVDREIESLECIRGLWEISVAYKIFVDLMKRYRISISLSAKCLPV